MRLYYAKLASKINGGYTKIEIVLDNEGEAKVEANKKRKEKQMEEDAKNSKLARPVKDLLRLIFDMDMMDR